MTAFSNKQVEAVFRMFPETSRRRLLQLREQVFIVAADLGVTGEIEETLKWGEPSYLAPKGSTIRMGWDEKDPDCVLLFFHCQTSLIETFRELFPRLEFEGNRAIRIPSDREIESETLQKCIRLAMTYHTVKRLPLLGAG